MLSNLLHHNILCLPMLTTLPTVLLMQSELALPMPQRQAVSALEGISDAELQMLASDSRRVLPKWFVLQMPDELRQLILQIRLEMQELQALVNVRWHFAGNSNDKTTVQQLQAFNEWEEEP